MRCELRFVQHVLNRVLCANGSVDPNKLAELKKVEHMFNVYNPPKKAREQ
ncbi:MAG: hypothetical protein WA213_21630 [Terriglobales bacterium]